MMMLKLLQKQTSMNNKVKGLPTSMEWKALPKQTSSCILFWWNLDSQLLVTAFCHLL